MILQALLLTVLAGAAIFDMLGPSIIQLCRPLLAGTVAGIIMGDIHLGMAIGATLELIALGVYTYGGASIPDYQTGAIIGTALAAAASGGLAERTTIGLAVGLPAALLLAALDPVGRLLPAFFMHKADSYAARGDARGLTLMHWLGFTPWLLTRMIPTFLAAIAASSSTVIALQKDIPKWLVDGLTFTGGLLPAVGFAMLLTMMPLKKYWYVMLVGFVLFAYLKVPLVGIALFALPVSIIFVQAQSKRTVENADDAAEEILA